MAVTNSICRRDTSYTKTRRFSLSLSSSRTHAYILPSRQRVCYHCHYIQFLQQQRRGDTNVDGTRRLNIENISATVIYCSTVVQRFGDKSRERERCLKYSRGNCVTRVQDSNTCSLDRKVVRRCRMIAKTLSSLVTPTCYRDNLSRANIAGDHSRNLRYS